jgi:hypothetical protein
MFRKTLLPVIFTRRPQSEVHECLPVQMFRKTTTCYLHQTTTIWSSWMFTCSDVSEDYYVLSSPDDHNLKFLNAYLFRCFIKYTPQRKVYFKWRLYVLTRQPCLCIKYVAAATEISESTQFRITVVANCRALTRCMNLRHVVGHERASSILLHCVMSILWVLIIDSRGYLKCSWYLLWNVT